MFLYLALNEPRAAAARSTAGAAKLALTPPAENHATPMSSPGKPPGGVDGLSYSKNWLQKRKGFQSCFWESFPGSPSCNSQSLSSYTLCRLFWRCSCCLRVIFSLIQHCNSNEQVPS